MTPARTVAARTRAAPPAAVARKPAPRATGVGGVPFTNPDKLYFPDAGITKRDLAAYYERVAERMLAHLDGRPLSLVRCPDGWKNGCFYQKHADRSVHASVTRVEVPEGEGTATYLSVGSVGAVVALVQWGVIEFHPWGSRRPRLDRPDRLVFDLDPDDALPWGESVAAVRLLHTLLDDLGLTAFLKTTGGKGLHVVVPIRPVTSWDDARAFTRGVADLMARMYPDRFTATAAKVQRKGRIFVDYLRNALGATAIAPYAVRARANAPVATPIGWNEIGRRDLRFDYFNVRTLPARLARMRSDPWEAFFTTRQSITVAMRRRVTG